MWHYVKTRGSFAISQKLRGNPRRYMEGNTNQTDKTYAKD